MEVQVPCMPQEEWYRGLCDVLNSTVESERGATGTGEAPGPSSAALTAERLKEAMQGASRAHRAWVVSLQRWRATTRRLSTQLYEPLFPVIRRGRHTHLLAWPR